MSVAKAVKRNFSLRSLRQDAGFTPRIPQLRALEGKYTLDLTRKVSFYQIPRGIREVLFYNKEEKPSPCDETFSIYGQRRVEEYFSTGVVGRVKVGKFLKRVLAEQYVDQFLNTVSSQSYEFEITTKFKDIVRMSESPHLNSCLARNRCGEGTKWWYLKNPNVALVVRRDKAGHFIFRMVIYAVRTYPEHGTGMGLLMNKIYGGPEVPDAISEAFCKQLNIPVFPRTSSPMDEFDRSYYTKEVSQWYRLLGMEEMMVRGRTSIRNL